MYLPKAKNTNIVVQDVGSELLIYDLLTHKAYNLNETSAKVFNACNGKTSFDDLKHKHKFTDEIINFALDELKKENLLADDYVSPFFGLSRREAIKKVGLASMIALPVVIGLTAPTAAFAASCPGSSLANSTAGVQYCTADSTGCRNLVSQLCHSCDGTFVAGDARCVSASAPNAGICTCK